MTPNEPSSAARATDTATQRTSSFAFFGKSSNGTLPAKTISAEASKNEEETKCQQCMSHLTSILSSIQSKPKVLFDAMGVVTASASTATSLKSHTASSEDNIAPGMKRNIFWTMDEDGKGLRVLIPKEYTYNHSLKQGIENEESKQQQQHDIVKKNNEHMESKQEYSSRNYDKKQTDATFGFGGVSTFNYKRDDSTTTISSDPIKKEKNNNGYDSNTSDNSSSSGSGSSSSGSSSTMLQNMKTKLSQTFHSNSANARTSSSSITTTTTTSPITSEIATSSIQQQKQQDQNLLDQNNSQIPNKYHITLEIQCRKCGTTGPEGSARAFLKGPTPLTIILCTNRLSLQSSDEINEVLTHELIHVYDVHHRNWNLSNCQTLAKSEIRAAREAECSSVVSKRFGLFWKDNCIKDKAKDATKNMFPYHGYDCVNAVFKDAMKDMMPFGVKDKEGGSVGRRENDLRSTIATSGGENNNNMKNGSIDGEYISGRSFKSSFSLP